MSAGKDTHERHPHDLLHCRPPVREMNATARLEKQIARLIDPEPFDPLCPMDDERRDERGGWALVVARDILASGLVVPADIAEAVSGECMAAEQERDAALAELARVRADLAVPMEGDAWEAGWKAGRDAAAAAADDWRKQAEANSYPNDFDKNIAAIIVGCVLNVAHCIRAITPGEKP